MNGINPLQTENTQSFEQKKKQHIAHQGKHLATAKIHLFLKKFCRVWQGRAKIRLREKDI